MMATTRRHHAEVVHEVLQIEEPVVSGIEVVEEVGVTPPQETADETLVRRRHSFVGLALAVVLVVGAIWLLEGGRIGEVASPSTAITLVGTFGGAVPRIGEPAPDFTLTAIDGQRLSLASLRGRPVMINFWASWCPPCRAEMPDLEIVYREYRDAGFVVLAINLQEERPVAQRYAETLGLTFPIVLDREGTVAARYSLTALPTSYFVDRDGIIRDLNAGALTAKGFRNKVAKVL